MAKTNADMTLEYVKEHCPVFQHGHYCPYDIPCLKGLGKGCPEFKNGCPFKDLKTIEEIKIKMGQMRDKCSASANHRKALDMFHAASGKEAFIYGHCPFFTGSGHPLSTDENGKPILPEYFTMEYVMEHCPSFQKGKFCPYNVPEIKELAKGCPAFKDGCPFKGLKTVGDMKGKLGEMRDLCKGKAQHSEALRIVNSINGKQVAKLGHCPFFKFECPLKTDREGKPIAPESITMDYIKSHCPSFEKGSACPYKALVEKGLKGLGKGCPEFKTGCPFKDVKDVGEFKTKLGQMRDGCKGKEAYSKALGFFHGANGEAVAKYGHCPFFKGGCCLKTDMDGKSVFPQSVEMDYIKIHCPAFKKGSACPYKALVEEGLKGLGKGCPEFKTGCPFKDVKDVGEFNGKLGKMRDDCKGKEAYTKALGIFHQTNTEEAAKIGHCSFNHNHCELKNDPQGKPIACLKCEK